MVEMMADGVETEITFRDGATPGTRRREKMMGDRPQVDGVRRPGSKRDHKSRSRSHFIALVTLVAYILDCRDIP